MCEDALGFQFTPPIRPTTSKSEEPLRLCSVPVQ
jgi:hypothetical protein